MQSSQELLNKLDKLLSEASTPSSPSYAEDLNDPAYTVQYELLEKRIQSYTDEVVQRIVERGCQMLSKSSPSVFRICSIGCGDGKLDQQVLTKISEKFPNVRIHFCAFDVNELFVEHAKESLRHLNNVEVEILARDIESVGNEFAPCDLVLCVHVLYYAKSLERALSNVLQLVKKDGVGLIFQGCLSTFNQLYRRFWFHEHQHPIKFCDDVTSALAKMGLRYHAQEIRSSLDLTDCFADDFQLPHQRHLLDFLTHTKLNLYPPIIGKTCIEYLSSIATGKPENYSLTRVTAVIDISKDQ